MKTRIGMLVLVALLAFSGVAMAASVEPVLMDLKTGDAYAECTQVGNYDFAYKVDPPMNGVYTEEGQTITISGMEDLYYFDWAVSPYPLGAVLVKAGPGAYNVFYYNNVSSDTDLYAPTNPNNDKLYEISHMTFCWNKTEGCYEEETAWAAGGRYVKKGNWAMYVEYKGEEKTVDLIADGGTWYDPPGRMGKVVGTVTFSAPVDDEVTITIALTGGTIFYYDPADPYKDDNIKIQDYEKAPTKNPAPGLFAWKTAAPVGETTVTVNVPVNNFYGVHVDVAVPVPCE